MQQALGTASVVGSLVLVAVTIWYAWQTQQMVREMRTARSASLRPNVRLDLGSFVGAVTVDIENVGVGPATDVSVELVVETDEGEFERQTWSAALMRTGDRRTMLMPSKGGLGNLMPLEELSGMGAMLRMTGTCLDLDRHTHSIDDTLSFRALADRGPEGSWEGVQDRWPKNVEKLANELERIRRQLERA